MSLNREKGWGLSRKLARWRGFPGLSKPEMPVADQPDQGRVGKGIIACQNKNIPAPGVHKGGVYADIGPARRQRILMILSPVKPYSSVLLQLIKTSAKKHAQQGHVASIIAAPPYLYQAFRSGIPRVPATGKNYGGDPADHLSSGGIVT
jgi:hypothetical protein